MKLSIKNQQKNETNMQNTISLPCLLEDDATLPSYASKQAAGADVKAHIPAPVVINPHERVLIPTGIRVEIPHGFEIQVRPRSGLAFNHGITVLNAPGTIDADYRGEICVLLINHSSTPFMIEPGMRIAQLVLAPVFQAEYLAVETLTATARGQGGFGHTGIHG